VGLGLPRASGGQPLGGSKHSLDKVIREFRVSDSYPEWKEFRTINCRRRIFQ
jgi:hypothetical protein